MFRTLLIFLIIALTCNRIEAQQDKAEDHRLITLGNVSDLKPNSPQFREIHELVKKSSTPVTLIVNGDILSKNSANGITRKDSLKIANLLSIVKGVDHARMILIPGDRDWADSGKKGWKRVIQLQKMIKAHKLPNVKWAIKDGCPGPASFELDDHILLIAIQTQWWNHPYNKPRPADATCKISTEGDFFDELEDLIEENQDKNIIVSGHYPLFSYGVYGGKWPLGKVVFPPVVGSFYTSYRRNVGSEKDIINENFDPFRKKLSGILSRYNSLIYLSAHEENLQILKLENNYTINSGSLADPKYAYKGKRAIYSESAPGIICIDYQSSGRVEAQVLKFSDPDRPQTITLFQSACEEITGTEPLNSTYIPCRFNRPVQETGEVLPEYATAVAGAEYKASKMKQFWLGKHYRSTWIKPVKVPYLNLDTTFNGLTPYEKGGGRQTTSLKFKANNGLEYVFRSVNKDPAKALSYDLRETFIAGFLRDQTTTQQPYGAMAIDVLLNETEILHAHPKLYVLPTSAKLGPFKEKYGELLGMLEDRPTNPKKVSEPFAGADELKKSYKLFTELYEDHDNVVHDISFARAKVFDVLVGDWGKHEDNWKWAGYKSDTGTLYYPIPRDRDHVFSRWDGVLPWLLDREWASSRGENFDYEIKGFLSLVWQARHLDRFICSELSKQDWLDAADYIQEKIDDEAIDRAVRSMPEETYELSGKEIAAKLKSRIKDLDRYAEELYLILAREVDVPGSNKTEYFDVQRNSDGSVEVTIYKLKHGNKEPDKAGVFYYRKFFPDETREIRLYGLGKGDIFNIEGKSDKSIRVRIIGGPGTDQIYDRSEVSGSKKHTLVYEKSKKADLELGTEAKTVHHWNEDVYHYNRTAFEYNSYLPLPLLIFSADDGFGASMGVRFTRHKFGKQDYASMHSIRVGATTKKNNVISYQGQWHHVIRKWDVTFSGLLADHYFFTYFFGIGNNTEKDEDLFDEGYYLTRYNSYQFNAGLSRDFWKESNFYFQLHYENNAEQLGDSTILSDQNNEILGTEDTNIGAIITGLDIDFRDRKNLPENGVRTFFDWQSGMVTSNDNKGYSIARASIETYHSVYVPSPITLGLRFGGSKNFGEVPFYKLKYLGQNNDLRGYLRNRFTGESTVFLNTELRVQLSKFKTSIAPMKFGIRGFADTGRVYSDNDTSGKWHAGYGGGFYLVPYKEDYSINVSFAFSEEESGLLLLSIGKSFR